MHAAVALWYRQDVFDAAEQVVGVEDSIFSHGFEAVGSMRAEIAIRADEDAGVAEKAANATNRQRPVVGQRVAIAAKFNDVPERSLAVALAELERAGFVFSERDNFLSLPIRNRSWHANSGTLHPNAETVAPDTAQNVAPAGTPRLRVL